MPDVKAMIDDMGLAKTPDSHCPQRVKPFWLPDLTFDWRARYAAPLEWMQSGDQQRGLLESQYRLLQKRFESGLSKPASVQMSGLIDSEGASEAATANPPAAVDLLALFQWTQAKQSNLGMVALHRWIDTAPLYSSSEDKSLNTNLENDPGLTQAREEATFAYHEADRFLSNLIRQQPDDVLAWTYRAKVRRNWAALIKLVLLPLSEQPIVCTPAMSYRRMMDGAQKDLEQAIYLWSRSFPDPDLIEANSSQSTQLARPIGTEPERKLIIHHLFSCYILLYSVYKAERSRDKAVEALSKAIWLKPRISLLLARAEQYYHLGQLQAAARDYFTSIQRVSKSIPVRLKDDFDRAVALLQLEMQAGEYTEVIRRSCRFWQANPMLLI